MTEIKVGDRVKVTFEGEYTTVYPGGPEGVRPEGHSKVFLYAGHALAAAAAIEKVEPPVETFGPGDVVRAKHEPGVVLFLDNEGYTYIGPANRGARPRYANLPGWQSGEITSEDFERVEI